MINIVSEKNILNNKIINKDNAYQIINNDKTGIYEVIRVINRKPVFLQEHFIRLQKSIKLSNIDYDLNYKCFVDDIILLIEQNEFSNCNIRITFDYDKILKKASVLYYFIKSSYPSKEYYTVGIHTILVERERKNPNIKKNSLKYREEIDSVLRLNNAYEAILISDKFISEGSKSNVFFVKGNTLITALDKNVLLGVTRNKVLELAKELKVNIEKRRIQVSEIKEFDAAFITGTSNNVLPINSINDYNFDSMNNIIVKKLMFKYEELL